MEKYNNNFASESNQYQGVPKNNNNIDDSLSLNTMIPAVKQISVFLMGWLGIKIIATIISLILRSVISIPDPYEYPELYTKAISSIEAGLEFAIYGILIISLFAILGKKLLILIFKDFKKADKIGKGLAYGIGMLALTIVINIIINAIHPIAVNENETGVRNIVKASPLFSFFFVVLFAPICEEITYRLGLCGFIGRKNKTLGIIASSTIFALIHCALFSMDYANFDVEAFLTELLNLPTYFASGFVLGYAYSKENSLATSITAHMTNNFIAYIQNFLISGVVINGFLR